MMQDPCTILSPADGMKLYIKKKLYMKQELTIHKFTFYSASLWSNLD